MSGAASAIHVPSIMNDKKVGAFQYLVVALCGLVMPLDGFDTQAIAYMAPLMAAVASVAPSP